MGKSKLIVFRNGGYLKSSEKWNFGADRIEVTSYYNYLGMLFSSRLCWSTCLANYAIKASRVVSTLRNLLNTIASNGRENSF